jgi:hypothetical protein
LEFLSLYSTALAIYCVLWKTKDHAETTRHKTSMENAKIIEKRVQNTHKRLFLESLHALSVGQKINK